MDYASDIDSYGMPIRKRKRGGTSFMVIATGSVFLAAAWIMAASDPYAELAHRVVEVKPDAKIAAEDERVPLFELAIDEAAKSSDVTAAGLEPGDMIEIGGTVYERPAVDGLSPDMAVMTLPGEDAVRYHDWAERNLIGPRMPESVRFERSLDTEQRRDVQRRLELAQGERLGVDGILGPKTRDALKAYQGEAGLTVTGYADKETIAALNEATEERYAAYIAEEAKAARRASARRDAARRGSATAPVPQERELIAAPGACRRNADGTIVGHQSLGCDLKGFGDAIGRIFRGESISGRGRDPEDFATTADR